MKLISAVKYLLREFLTGLVSLLPNDILSVRFRRSVLCLCGFKLGAGVLVYRNVLIIGRVEIGDRSSISNNTSINGSGAGVYIGSDVMIAPGCCVVAFDHGMSRSGIPMINQSLVEAPIHIEDDVWIAANCTITKGVRIGFGSIVAANSVVVKDVEPYSIVGGVPAKFIRYR